jgi:D-glycero-alpha-D-manno-heptose-7-phosphate kinase
VIITRSPLRISLGGGGTDIPSYYRAHTGFLISAAIDKYVYVTLHETFPPEILVKYSRMERVGAVDEVRHPIVREALRLVPIDDPHIEITSMADIPAGTGLGSSGSFTTALLRALHTYRKNFVPPRELAEQACHIEIDLLKEPVGKQDQYVAAFGGITCFTFHPNDEVEVAPLRIAPETLNDLKTMWLFFTGFTWRIGHPSRSGRAHADNDEEMVNSTSSQPGLRPRMRWSAATCASCGDHACSLEHRGDVWGCRTRR